MKLLFAPDSFKGSLTSKQQIALLREAAREVFPDCDIVETPVADGGEGTMEALVDSFHGRLESLTVKGPLGGPVDAAYGILNENTVIIEMAQASGLPLVDKDDRNPFLTSTYGTGEMIAHVLKEGYSHILLAIGGSATNDGGMGAASALGIVFLDESGQALTPCGGSLNQIRVIDDSGLLPAFRQARFTIMCDVDNPLLGPRGATYVYGPQKGASPEICEELEAGMSNYNAVLKAQYGVDYADMKGAGAAGGLSVPFLTFSQAELKAGIDTVFDAIDFSSLLDDVDLVVTGEGRTDEQSAYGKVLYGIGQACLKKNIPAVSLVGCLGPGYEAIYSCGIDSLFTITDGPMSLEKSMSNAANLYKDSAKRLFRLIRVGMRIG
ncbi:MAG: glycerate kinase [Eubacterium sp.]|nr:glycerate kinase [Eubacterium sp.]